MNVNYYKRYRSRYGKSVAVDLESAIVKLLEAMGGDPQKAKFARLWEEWQAILGEELAAMVTPLGTDKKHLLVGVEDALAMQEAQYQKDDILQKINAWLGQDYFDDVRLSLMLGREARKGKKPDPILPENDMEDGMEEMEKSGATGIYLKNMDPNSPVAKAYARYAKKK